MKDQLQTSMAHVAIQNWRDQISITAEPDLTDDIIQWAEGLPLDGRHKFTMYDRPWLNQILQDKSDIVCSLKSRQTGMSSLFAVLMGYFGQRIPGIQMMYCSMREDQFRYFNRHKLRPILGKTNTKLGRDENRIKSLQLENKSLITFVSGHDEFAQSRGYPVDILFLDEAEKLPIDSLINITETMEASDIARMYIAGTGGIEGFPWPQYWEDTTKMEWQDGKWIPTNPNGTITGYHVTQRLLPGWTQAKEDAKRAAAMRKGQSIAKFEMEVLGINTTLADVPLPEAIVRACMDGTSWITSPPAGTIIGSIDLAGGGAQSDTVIAISCLDDTGKLHLLEAVRSTKKLAADIYPEIAPILDKWNCNIIGSDAGGNPELLHMLSESYDMYRFWLGAPKTEVKYNTNQEGTPINKTFFTQKLISRFHSYNIVIPDAAPWVMDQLTATSQEAYKSRTGEETVLFDKIPGRKNDLFMALVFAEACIFIMTDEGNPNNRVGTYVGSYGPKW